MTKCQTCCHNEELDKDLVMIVDYDGFSTIGCELNIPGYPEMESCVHWYELPLNGE